MLTVARPPISDPMIKKTVTNGLALCDLFFFGRQPVDFGEFGLMATSFINLSFTKYRIIDLIN